MIYWHGIACFMLGLSLFPILKFLISKTRMSQGDGLPKTDINTPMPEVNPPREDEESSNDFVLNGVVDRASRSRGLLSGYYDECEFFLPVVDKSREREEATITIKTKLPRFAMHQEGRGELEKSLYDAVQKKIPIEIVIRRADK